MKKWMIVALFVCVAGVFLVGHFYFNNFNNFFATSPNCVSDCYENGIRVR